MTLSPIVDNSVNIPPTYDLWNTIKVRVKEKIGEISYNNWLKQILEGRIEENHLIIRVPNRFIADWITDYYLEMLEKEASHILGQEISVRYEVFELEKTEEKPPEEAETLVSLPPLKPKVGTQVKNCPPLNPKYTFENFVVGSGNQLPQAAAKAVSELPGGHYNPLFLYGGVGLGKTHLLHAVGIAILKKHNNFRITYVSSEQFMNEFINSVRHDHMTEFRKKYRESCDMLLIDDIQFLGGKESTQDEFFHTFNALYDSERQIILTSDKIPQEIPGLEERLRSRFEWGLIADIQPPDLETRVAILRKKAETDKIFLSDDVAMYLASTVKSNVRELEGALIRLNAFASLTNQRITIDLAKEVFKNHSSQKILRRTTAEAIQEAVAQYYQIKPQDLRSPSRVKNFSHPRQVAMYLCKRYLNLSFPEIGQKFGGKDHTTVMYACRKIENLLENDPDLQKDLAILEKTIH